MYVAQVADQLDRNGLFVNSVDAHDDTHGRVNLQSPGVWIDVSPSRLELYDDARYPGLPIQVAGHVAQLVSTICAIL